MWQRQVEHGRQRTRAARPGRAHTAAPAPARLPPGRPGACACDGQCPRCVDAGQPLAGSVRTKMETGLGASLANVRIHADARADVEARRRNAHAFTLGADIYFAAGKFAPHTREGTIRLAHELVHVEQQRAGRAGRVHAVNGAAEREARSLGIAAASGQRGSVRAAAPRGIQRDGPDADTGAPTPDAPQLALDPKIEALALRHLIRWWLGTALVEDSAPTEVSESGGAEESSEVVPGAGVQMPVGAPLPPIVFQLPLQSSLFDPLPPDPLYIEPDVGALFSGFHSRGAPVGEGDMPVVFDIYRRNQAIAGALPDLRAIAPSFLRTVIPPTWRRDIAGALTGAAVGAYLNRDYMTPIEVSDRAWEAMTGAGTTMIPFPSVSF